MNPSTGNSVAASESAIDHHMTVICPFCFAPITRNQERVEVEVCGTWTVAHTACQEEKEANEE